MEEKIIEIAQRHHRIYDDYYDSMQECIDSAIEAAEWKEQQLIEKAAKWIRLHIHMYENEYQAVIDFKKAMEE